jgi:hypothetical protein
MVPKQQVGAFEKLPTTQIIYRWADIKATQESCEKLRDEKDLDHGDPESQRGCGG